MTEPSLISIHHLGRQPYERVWRAMQQFTDARNDETVDQLWIVEHDPIFTLGQAGKIEHVLKPGDIPVLAVDRGGQVTYHGPGQIVAYPLLDLRRLGISVKDLVCRIEQAIIDTCLYYGVKAMRRSGAPGVYVGSAKIAALGLRVRRGCCFHGLAFNINMDLKPFTQINPCGYQGLEVTQLLDYGGPGDLNDVVPELITALQRTLELQLQPETPLNKPATTMIFA